MKKPVIIIRSHHIGFVTGFAIMMFAAIGIKETLKPEAKFDGGYQQVGKFAQLPDFQISKNIDQTEADKRLFWANLEDK